MAGLADGASLALSAVLCPQQRRDQPRGTSRGHGPELRASEAPSATPNSAHKKNRRPVLLGRRSLLARDEPEDSLLQKKLAVTPQELMTRPHLSKLTYSAKPAAMLLRERDRQLLSQPRGRKLFRRKYQSAHFSVPDSQDRNLGDCSPRFLIPHQMEVPYARDDFRIPAIATGVP